VTLAISSGHCLRREYTSAVMEVQLPKAASSRSKAKSRISAPFRYRFVGSQSVRAGTISCTNPAALPRTVTVCRSLASVFADRFLMSIAIEAS